MSRRMLQYVAAAALGLIGNAVMADTGPAQTPLRITGMYTKGGNGSIYVQFQNGSMPNCYANAGGYLLPTNSFYKEIYAQLMIVAAGGSLKAAVIYTRNVQTGNWGDCTIDGLYLVE
jgi:hypothetical protein